MKSAAQLAFMLSTLVLINNAASKPMALEDVGLSETSTEKELDIPPREARQEDTETAGTGTNTGANGATSATGTGSGAGTGNNIGYLYSTYANVGQILNGVSEGDIAPILAGGAAFIPAGELRQSVSQLLTRNVAPQVQRLFQDVGNLISRQLNRNNTTPSPSLSPAQLNPNQNGQLPANPTAAAPQDSNQPSQTITLMIPNPLGALQSRLQGAQSGGSPFEALQNRLQGGQTGEGPLQSIRNRLQSLIPSFGGGGDESKNAVTPISSSNVVYNPINNGVIVENGNRYKHDIPVSPLD